jgi:hypothetical protein
MNYLPTLDKSRLAKLRRLAWVLAAVRVAELRRSKAVVRSTKKTSGGEVPLPCGHKKRRPRYPSFSEIKALLANTYGFGSLSWAGTNRTVKYRRSLTHP